MVLHKILKMQRSMKIKVLTFISCFSDAKNFPVTLRFTSEFLPKRPGANFNNRLDLFLVLDLTLGDGLLSLSLLWNWPLQLSFINGKVWLNTSFTLQRIYWIWTHRDIKPAKSQNSGISFHPDHLRHGQSWHGAVEPYCLPFIRPFRTELCSELWRHLQAIRATAATTRACGCRETVDRFQVTHNGVCGSLRAAGNLIDRFIVQT